MRNKRISKTQLIVTVLVLIFMALAAFLLSRNPQSKEIEKLNVHFIDVGQGDCSLIEFPDGKTMLIDAGERDKGDDVCRYLKNRGISKIDFLIGTHPHSDHIGGLAEVIEKFEIGQIYMPKVSHTSASFENVLLAAKRMGEKIASPKAGEVIHQSEGLSVKVLSPAKAEYDNLNNYSIVIKIDYKGKGFLFTGDAENEALLDIKEDVKADVLKVAHHGSSTSDSKRFMKKVLPEIAVISLGVDNEYGHPHKEVISLLKNVGAKVYRTDEMGTVIVSTDGGKIKIETMR